MKKVLSILLTLLIVVGAIAVVPFNAAENDTAEVGAEPDLAGTGELILSQNGLYYYSILDDGTIEIASHRYDKEPLGYANLGYAYKVPSAIDGYTVTRIAQNAFAYTQCKYFFIPPSITRWYESEFNKFSSVKPLVIYERVTPTSHHREGSNAYPQYEYHLLDDGTACLDVIRPVYGHPIIPDTLWDGTTVSAIAPDAFQPIKPESELEMHNQSLGFEFRGINIKPVLSAIPDNLFRIFNNVKLSITADTVLYENSLPRYGELTLTIVGDSDIPDNYLESKKGRINTLSIGGSIENIGESAFEEVSEANFHEIYNVTIKGNVKNIGKNAFSFNYRMEKLTMEDGIKSIGEKAFYGCKKLYSVTIPPSVTEIGEKAFGYYFYTDGYDWADYRVSNFTIYGVRGTAAERYANENRFKFVPIEPSTVNGLEISLTEPEPGEMPDYSAVVPEGRGYAVDSEGGVMWFNVTDDDTYIDPNSDYTFEPYKEYRVMISLVTTDDEYKFAATNRRAELNGMDVGFSDYGWNEEHSVYVESYYVCAPEGGTAIREAAVEMDEPSVGDMPYYYAMTDSDLYRVTDAEDDDDRYISNGIGWYNETDSREMAYTDRFEAGKTYQWSIRLTSNGCSFAPADEIVATVNGKNARVKRLSDRTVELWVYYTMPGGAESFILGDVDDSGKADVVDATIVQRYATSLKISIPEEQIAARGDVNGSGKTDITDATLIQRYATNIPTPYPIGK